MIGRAKHRTTRTFWSILYCFCLSAFVYNAHGVINTYLAHEKIVDIQLVFNPPPFPSVTLCNLNPYKYSAVRENFVVMKTLHGFDQAMDIAGRKHLKNLPPPHGPGQHGQHAPHPHRTKRHTERAQAPYEEISNMLMSMKVDKKNDSTPAWAADWFHDLSVASNVNDSYPDAPSPTMSTEEERVRAKRASKMPSFRPVEARCECDESNTVCQPVPGQLNHPPEDGETTCICAFEPTTNQMMMCLPKDSWSSPIKCAGCNQIGQCSKDPGQMPGAAPARCVCTDADPPMCIAHKEHLMRKMWESDAVPTLDPLFFETLGFKGMTDEVAIVTQAKQNIMLAMANQTFETKTLLSYTREEFVHKCSFNGKGCNITKDFQIHEDPTFGNCFTFNYNRSETHFNSRAGPMHGLRLIVYVNVDEYLPTTEAAGIKLTIHEKDQFPYPDTFGYNAPVGYISSFGIKLKRMARLPAPYGECEADGQEKVAIFGNYSYSMEGCFRQCYQQSVASKCGCYDPRQPVIDGVEQCDAFEFETRQCLEGAESGGGSECRCIPPCEQAMYSVTYSASVWPSPSLRVQLGMCDKSHAECVQHYKDNGAMIEVFYEMLSFEMLAEQAAYGFTNLLSDFGGQFGLWLGLSMLSCFEFVFLAFRFGSMSAEHHLHQRRQEQQRKQREKKRNAI